MKPTRSRELALIRLLDLCRLLYNTAIEQRRMAWRGWATSLSYYDQQNQLPALRKAFPEFAEVHNAVLQNVVRRVDHAYRIFFAGLKAGRKVGLPRFKSWRHYASFTFPSTTGFTVRPGLFIINRIGGFRMVTHRPVAGRVRMATISRKPDGWYVHLVTDHNPVAPPNGLPSIGIDVGLTVLATGSDGSIVENPRWYLKAERRLAVLGRRLSRKKKGSARREMARLRLAKEHLRLSRRRHHHLHVLTSRLVRTHGLVAVERLAIQGLVRWPFGKHILDAGWGEFVWMLEYKGPEHGCWIVFVDPAWTSQSCSGCGKMVRKPLRMRVHSCPSCGLVLGRDWNAALNILGRAVTGAAEAEKEGRGELLRNNARGDQTSTRPGWGWRVRSRNREGPTDPR